MTDDFFYQGFAPWLPKLIDIEHRKDAGEPAYQNIGFDALDIPSSLEEISDRAADLKVRFDERYAYRMINSETLPRWQNRLQNRFDEIADRYERAYRLYAANGAAMMDDILPGWKEVMDRTDAASGTDTTTRTGNETLGMTGTESLEKTGSEEVAKSGTETMEKTGKEETAKTGSETDTKSGTETDTKNGTRELSYGGTEKITDGGTDTETKRFADTPDSAINLSDSYADRTEKSSLGHGKTEEKSFTNRKDTETYTNLADVKSFTNRQDTKSFTDRKDTTSYDQRKDTVSYTDRKDTTTYNQRKDTRSFENRVDTRTYNQVADALVHGKQVDIDYTLTHTETGSQIIDAVNEAIRKWQDLDTQFVQEFENLFLNIFWY